MRLPHADWKIAWFDSQISDRFFQEMTKLGNGNVAQLDTAAQWMEQIMVDLGQLAQGMMRLEDENPGGPQLRQAFDKSLRLSALALHLMTALDQAYRELQGGSATGKTGAAPLQLVHPRNSIPHGGAGIAVPSAPQNTQAVAATAPLRPPQPRGLPPRMEPAGRSVGAESVPTGAAPPAAEQQFSSSPEDAGFNEPLLSPSLITIEGGGSGGGNQHQTILSLASRGLSRAEIEVITGQPRHIVEAVLLNDRKRKSAG